MRLKLIFLMTSLTAFLFPLKSFAIENEDNYELTEEQTVDRAPAVMMNTQDVIIESENKTGATLVQELQDSDQE